MNMSYCKFENTLADMRQCFEAIEDEEQPISSRTEERAFRQMVEEMVYFLNRYELLDEDGDLDEKELNSLIEELEESDDDEDDEDED